MQSTEAYYIFSLLTWSSTARDTNFAYGNLQNNCFFLDFSPHWRLKAQSVKVIAHRNVFDRYYGIGKALVTPFVTKIGNSSMTVDFTIELLDIGFNANDEDVRNCRKILVALTTVSIVFTNEIGRPTKHPFSRIDSSELHTPRFDWENIKFSQNSGLKLVYKRTMEGRPSDVDGVGHIHNANYIYIINDALFYFLNQYYSIGTIKRLLQILEFSIEYNKGVDPLELFEVHFFLEDYQNKCLQSSSKDSKNIYAMEYKIVIKNEDHTIGKICFALRDQNKVASL